MRKTQEPANSLKSPAAKRLHMKARTKLDHNEFLAKEKRDELKKMSSEDLTIYYARTKVTASKTPGSPNAEGHLPDGR